MKTTYSHRITRRTALQRVAKLGLLAGALGPVALRSAAAEEAKPDFKFIVVNDTHYLSAECGAYFTALVKQMNAEGAALCLHAGDVTDLGKLEHEETTRAIFARLDVPFYCVPGNHDWLTQTDLSGYENAFPQRRNYSFTHGGWQFVALDTTEGQKADKTTINPATFTALEGILSKLDKQKPTVVLTHFPLCENVRNRPLNAEDLLAKFKGWNVRHIFNGHYHAFTECERDGSPITTNRCCSFKRNNHDGSKEKGYFVCEAAAGKLTRRFVEFKGV